MIKFFFSKFTRQPTFPNDFDLLLIPPYEYNVVKTHSCIMQKWNEQITKETMGNSKPPL